MAKCEHDIGCEYNYGFSNLISEEELYKTILESIKSDCAKGKLNFRRKNYIPKDSMDYMFYFFDYCPWCGEKLDEREIQQRLNKRAQEYVRKIDREKYELDLIELREIQPKHEEKHICAKSGYVYLIKMGDYYKIGISKKPNTRIDSFTKMPDPIEIIYIEKVYGYVDAEKELHEKYNLKNKRGEWFSLDEKDIEDIKKYLQERKCTE